MSLIDFHSKDKEVISSIINNGLADVKWISTIIESYIYSFADPNLVFDDENYTQNCLLRNGEYHGEYTLRDEEGNLRNKGMCEYGKKVGLWTWWHANGKLLQQVYYVDDKIEDGDSVTFDQDGHVILMVRFQNGKMNGLVKEFYASGQLKGCGNMLDGKKHGIYKQYFENGQVSSKTEYDHDYGRQRITYHPSEVDTEPMKHEQFNYNLQNDPETGAKQENVDCFIWNPQGRLLKKYHVRNSKRQSKRHGDYQVWNDDGILIHHVIFDDDVLTQTIV